MLLLDLDKPDISNFVKGRISNSRLFIEQGRYKKNPVENRICPLCSLDIEDEIPFSIVYPKLDSPRHKHFEKIISVVPSFSDLSESEKFNLIFSSNEYDINKICVKGVSDMYNYRNAIYRE